MAKRLVDKAIIKVTAGKGGDGMASFRREKYIPKGGPDGGDGGHGGNVYIVGSHNLATLLDFKAKTHYKAENGQGGTPKKMHGKNGDDLFITVPIGTLVYERTEDGDILVGDIVDDSAEPLLIARGGKGGLGNDRFKSSTNQTPRERTLGAEGEEKELIFEIKLVADVGLVGFPNAGKSTLINSLTSSKAKIGSYPFTTLVPNLAPYKLPNGQQIIVADIPGLIEGASEGKGLGDDFLRHVERTRIIVHMIDPLYELDYSGEFTPEVLAANSLQLYKSIRNELGDYSEELTKKPEIVAINKVDVSEVREASEHIIETFRNELNIDAMMLSAFTGENTDSLAYKLLDALEKAPARKVFESNAEDVALIYTPENLPNRRVVQQ